MVDPLEDLLKPYQIQKYDQRQQTANKPPKALNRFPQTSEGVNAVISVGSKASLGIPLFTAVFVLKYFFL